MQKEYHLWGINDLTPGTYKMLRIIFYERSRWRRQCDESREALAKSKMAWRPIDALSMAERKEYL